MKREDINLFFFCKSHDFLHIYIPRQNNGSEHTKTTYTYGMKAFRKYVNEVAGIPTNKFKFSDCTYDFLLDYRNHLHDVMHLAKSTCNNRLATVKSYMNYVAGRDVSLQQFAFVVSRVPFYAKTRKLQPIIEDADALTSLLNMPPNTRTGLRDKAMMAILYDVGIRVEELVSINVRDLSIREDCIPIKIRGKGDNERIVVLDEYTTPLVKQYLSEFHPGMKADTPLFYTVIKGEQGPMTTRNVQKRIKKYADKVREKHDLPERVSPHTFRRTRGTHLYRDGVPLEAIARMFGHKNIQTTRDHYSSPSLDQMKDMAAKRGNVIPGQQNEEPIWPDNEEEMSEVLGF